MRRFLRTNARILDALRHRAIGTLTARDHDTVLTLFDDALAALAASRAGKTLRSPVAVAKTLHLLAPGFFPLWDRKIAKAYGCSYYTKQPAARYLAFTMIAKEMVASMDAPIRQLRNGTTPLKVLDEYNYAKFTRAWV